jgi:hypothetical protein
VGLSLKYGNFYYFIILLLLLFYFILFYFILFYFILFYFFPAFSDGRRRPRGASWGRLRKIKNNLFIYLFFCRLLAAGKKKTNFFVGV